MYPDLKKTARKDDHICNSFAELASIYAGEPYILAAESSAMLYVWSKNIYKFRRQFARVEYAHMLGIPEKYNWRSFTFDANIHKTVADLHAVIKN